MNLLETSNVPNYGFKWQYMMLEVEPINNFGSATLSIHTRTSKIKDVNCIFNNIFHLKLFSSKLFVVTFKTQ